MPDRCGGAGAAAEVGRRGAPAGGSIDLMSFDPAGYGAEVTSILALDGGGDRLMPLAGGVCSSREAFARLRATAADALFPAARAPQAAMAGLYLYFSCLDEAHAAAQEIATAEGSFWHAILHRQEPDPDNAAYWFHRVGRHATFPALAKEAAAIAAPAGIDLPSAWDPFAFIDLCERARRDPGSKVEQAALLIQRAEWRLLFDYCARR